MLVLAAPLAVNGLALRGKDGLQTAASVAQLVGIPLMIPTLAVPLWLWWRRSTAPAGAASSQDIAKAKDVLAGLVAEQWKTEAAVRSLDDPDPMPVQWRFTAHGEVMDHLANVGSRHTAAGRVERSDRHINRTVPCPPPAAAGHLGWARNRQDDAGGAAAAGAAGLTAGAGAGSGADIGGGLGDRSLPAAARLVGGATR
jgi:hypothetical protein